jgi:hypothetical protein
MRHGSGAVNGWRAASLICTVLHFDRHHTRQDDPGRLARRFAARDGVAIGVSVRACRRHDQQPRGAGVALWRTAAQGLSWHCQRQRQPLGGAVFVAAPNLLSAEPVDLWRLSGCGHQTCNVVWRTRIRYQKVDQRPGFFQQTQIWYRSA